MGPKITGFLHNLCTAMPTSKFT